MSEQWLSIVEYARQFNMSDMTIRRRIKTGKIQAVLREGKYFIPMSEALRKFSPQPQANHSQQQNHKPQRIHAQEAPMVKSHPLPEKTYVAPPAPMHTYTQHTHSHTHAQMQAEPMQHAIPMHLRQTTLNQSNAMVDSATLVAFCEGALKKATESEYRLEAMYKEMVGKLEAEIRQRDAQIKGLAQQVEDLQLLTKILERKK